MKFGAIAAFLGLFAACSSSTPAAPAPAASSVSRADIGDVVYEPGTNDEGVLALLGAPVVNDAAGEPVITAPLDQAVLSTPVTFIYRVGASSRRVRPLARPPLPPDWLTFERSAFAHGIPMNGDAFFLVFSTPSQPKLLRVFTQDGSYAPSADEWQRLVGPSEALTLTVTHAIFEEGHLTGDGGPFTGKSAHFTLAH